MIYFIVHDYPAEEGPGTDDRTCLAEAPNLREALEYFHKEHPVDEPPIAVWIVNRAINPDGSPVPGLFEYYVPHYDKPGPWGKPFCHAIDNEEVLPVWNAVLASVRNG